jgi:hypothetical protein
MTSSKRDDSTLSITDTYRDLDFTTSALFTLSGDTVKLQRPSFANLSTQEPSVISPEDLSLEDLELRETILQSLRASSET